MAGKTTDDLTEGSNLYLTQSRFDTLFSAKDTGDLSEGTNLYYTQSRFDTAFSGKTTTNLSEGTNLYWTQDRFNTGISGITSDDITQGSTNLYFNQSTFDTYFAAKDTGDLTEGTNLYYTNARVESYLSGTSPIGFASGVISIQDATTSQKGSIQLSNSYSGTSEILATTEKALKDGLDTKESTLTKGNLTAASSKIIITGGTGAVIGSGTTIDVVENQLDHRYLDNREWSVAGHTIDTDIDMVNNSLLNVESIKFNLTPTQTTEEGKMWWDADDGTMNIGMSGGVVAVQVGQENVIRAKNGAGQQITNGQLVYISGALGNNVVMDLANASDHDKACCTIAMATEDVNDEQFGYFTTFGYVRDLNTNSFTEGDRLYLDTTDGGFTNTPPEAPNSYVFVGVVARKHIDEGKVFVKILPNPNLDELSDVYINSILDNDLLTWDDGNSRWQNQSYADITQDLEPTGFVQTVDNLPTTDSIVSFNNGNRTFSIQPVGDSFDIYVRGKKFTKTSQEDFVISDTEGMHYIYYNTLGVLDETLSEGIFETDVLSYLCIVAAIYWDKTNQAAIYIGEERHMNSISGSSHTLQHITRGSQFISGSAINNIDTDQSGDLDAHAQFGVDAGEIRDEDLRDLSAGVVYTTGTAIFYRDGIGNWRRQLNTGFNVLTAGTGRLAWNEFSGGTWSVSEVGNNDFVLYHIFQNNDTIYPHISVMGQDTYGNIAAAREGATTEINELVTTGLPMPEYVPIATIIFQTSDSYGNAVKGRTRTTDAGDDWIDWRTSGLSPSAVSPTSHLLLSELNGGDGVGNHTNAANLLGRTGGQILIGGTLTTEKLRLQDNIVDANYIEIGSSVDLNSLNISNIGTIGTGVYTFTIDETKSLSDYLLIDGTRQMTGSLTTVDSNSGNTSQVIFPQSGYTSINIYNRNSILTIGTGTGTTNRIIRFGTTGIYSHENILPDLDNSLDLGKTSNGRWKDIYLAGNLTDDINSVSVSNLKTAYDHSQDNSQAHSDYLINNGDDTTTGRLTASGFTSDENIIINADDKKLILGAGSDAELYINSDNLIIKNTTQDKDIEFYINDGGVDTLAGKFYGATGNFSVNGNSFYVDAVNNRIGVGTNTPSVQLEISDTGTAVISKFDRTDGATMQMSVGSTQAFFGSITNHTYTLISNNTNRLRIQDDGKIKIGTGSTTTQFHVVGDFLVENAADDFKVDTSGDVFAYNLNGAVQGANPTVWYNTTTGLLSYDTSAERYKENIQDLGDTSWLYDLRPVSFDEKEGRTGLMGLIAEEVAQVKPELVFYKPSRKTIEVEEDDEELYEEINEKGEKETKIRKIKIKKNKKVYDYDNMLIEGVAYTEIIPALINEIKNLKKENDDIKGRLDILEQ